MHGRAAYREEVLEFDEFASAAKSGRRHGRQVSDLVVPRHRIARLDLVRSRHDLQDDGRPTHLLVGVKRRVLPHRPHDHTHVSHLTRLRVITITFAFCLRALKSCRLLACLI